MTVKMHEIKGAQLRYYRMRFMELDDETVQLKMALKELRATLEASDNKYTISSLMELIKNLDNELDYMLEVLNMKEEHDTLSDDELAQLAWEQFMKQNNL